MRGFASFLATSAVVTVVTVVTVAVVTSSAGPSFGQGSPQKQLEDACRIAVEDLDLGDAVGAELRVSEALARHGRGPLAKSSITARAHAVLGAALMEQGHKDKAAKAFATAVSIDAKVALPPRLDKGAAKEALAAARVPSTPERPAPTPPPSMDPDSPVLGIVHIGQDAVKEGQTLPVEVKVGAEVKAAKVVVHYRGLGAKAWLTAPLAKTKGLLWKAEIPAAATVADSIQYYVDSTNAKGKRVAARGSKVAPYVVAVLKTAKPTATDKKLDNENPLLDVEENPLDQVPKKKPKK